MTAVPAVLSHGARRAVSGFLALEDRGLPMLRAMCAATAVLKDGLSAEQALDRADRLVAALPAAPKRREILAVERVPVDDEITTGATVANPVSLLRADAVDSAGFACLVETPPVRAARCSKGSEYPCAH